ncbi:FAD-dependent urate hydroxylase [Rhynchospora pubera]|uniref:FAD-dependent urate hydroxylase n=1 Tax=Rhynchospora pubera TaxID=906938 RepID=A0AAV8FQM9_9POAL|nr:FAD-dependent urate hydroxylase [Rhynchospora pubera]KAJ4795568.1 FAD-dependent urate hydroxylase [Rhynchospora pubera]
MPPEDEAGAEYEVVVVGAGIAGLACATALHQAGVRRLLLLDKYDGVRSNGAAVLLYPNGWHALEALGLAHKLKDTYPACYLEKQTNLETGETKEMLLTSTVDRPGIGVRTVHRKALLKVLAEELPQDSIRFTSKLVSLKSEQASEESPSGFTKLNLDDGSVIRTKVLIGCDGVHSVVAQWLGLSQPADSQRSIVRGLAKFEKGHDFSNELQEYVFKDKRGACVPANDQELYWYIAHDTDPKDLEVTMHPRLIIKQVMGRLAEGFPDKFKHAVSCSDLNTVAWTHMLYRTPWGLFLGWPHRNLITVAGDAFHPIASDLSLGSCMALEDAVILARHVNSYIKNQHGLKDAIEAYVKQRRWRVALLAAWSFLSVWAHHSWSRLGFLGWAVRFLCKKVYNWFVVPRIKETKNYDCRNLNIGG